MVYLGCGRMIKHIKKLFMNNNTSAESHMKKDLTHFKDNVISSFSNLKKDMEYQRKWIEHLHSSHKQIDSLHSVLHDKHNHHQKVHARDIDNINKWISHLHDTSKRHESAIKELETNISLAFDNYNRYLIDVYKAVVDIKHKNNQNSDDHGRVYGRTQTRLDDQKMSLEDKNHNGVITKKVEALKGGQLSDERTEKPTLEHYSEVLTRSEKNILAELCNTSQKLSYKDLAVMTGVSSNTVKNHICHIKNKGFPIKEQNDRNGIKRYFVQDSIKKVLLSKTI